MLARDHLASLAHGVVSEELAKLLPSSSSGKPYTQACCMISHQYLCYKQASISKSGARKHAVDMLSVESSKQYARLLPWAANMALGALAPVCSLSSWTESYAC